jgi:hypothetical protein
LSESRPADIGDYRIPVGKDAATGHAIIFIRARRR